MNMKRNGTAALVLTVAMLAIVFAACRTTQPAKVQFDDSAITTSVKASFIDDPIVKALQVDVTTNEGIVMLSGRVNTAAESKQAEKIARNTNGVKGVRNMIKVGPMPANP
jgi:hyperosmotically inducible protein